MLFVRFDRTPIRCAIIKIKKFIQLGCFNKNQNHPKGGFDFWQGHLCNSRTNEIKELLQFGKEVKAFLDVL